jgi:hypothetical protein
MGKLSRQRRRLFIGLSVAIGLAAALVLAEIALRVMLSWQQRGRLHEAAAQPFQNPRGDMGFVDLICGSENPRLVYTMRPGTRGRLAGAPVEVNSLGLRGPEPPLPGDGSNLTIVGLGDSHSFGWGVPVEETYLSRLHAALNAAARPGTTVRAINMGVPGYNAVQEAEQFETLGLTFEPDIVLIQYCLNDNVLPSFLTRRDHLTSLRRLYLLSLISSLKQLLGRGQKGDMVTVDNALIVKRGQPYEMNPAEVPDEFQHLLGWDHLVGAYERLKATCDERGIALYCVLPTENPWEPFKWGQGRGQDHPTRDPHYDKIRGLGRELGISVIDTFEGVYDFTTARGWDSANLSVNPPEDNHPNGMKHSVIAQEILKTLAPELEAGEWVDAGKVAAALDAMRAENAARAEKRIADDEVIVVPEPEELLD